VLFFNSPGKAWINRKLKAKAGRAATSEGSRKSPSASDFRGGALGLPDDPMKEIEDIQREILAKKEEVMQNRKNSMNATSKNK